MQLALALCVLLSLVGAQDTASGQDDDPFLQYRPEFARSLPIQILCSGVILTLVAVLLIHLVFTAQYHWSLTQVNYVSQLSSVVTLLIEHIVTLHVVLSETKQESQNWPYMLSYAALYPDPSDWEITKRATWYVMFAVSTGLIQITQIQFLTLLYPSHVEVKLIFLFLTPICITSAGMQLLEIHPNDHIHYLASAGRHVCNATLYLLFTVALFAWGFFVNRKQAWRFDGGTAVFGAVTLALAVFSTTLYFLYVATEHVYMWLSGLLWTVVVWQSFLGWWWWVGAGSGLAVNGKLSVEERIQQAEKREKRKRENFEKKAKAKLLWKGVAGNFSKSNKSVLDKGTTVTPSDPGSSGASPPTAGGPCSLLPRFILEWYNALRNAHRAAAQEQNAERAERILEMERGGIIPLARLNFRVGSDGTRIGGGSQRGNLARQDLPGQENLHRRESLSEIRERGPHNEAARQDVIASGQEEDSKPSRQESMLWWGPLRRWRLQDVTSYYA